MAKKGDINWEFEEGHREGYCCIRVLTDIQNRNSYSYPEEYNYLKIEFVGEQIDVGFVREHHKMRNFFGEPIIRNDILLLYAM